MKIAILVDTSGAEDGYNEGDEPDFDEHMYNIGELLREQNYEIDRSFEPTICGDV